MNEKYIQALILGSLIGGAILFDDFVKPKKEKSMKKHMIIKSDFKEEDLPDIEDIQKIDVLQNMDIIKGAKAKTRSDHRGRSARGIGEKLRS